MKSSSRRLLASSRLLSPAMMLLLATATAAFSFSLHAASPPPGFTPLYNGKDLSGWRGGDTFDHRKWLALPEAERAAKNAEWTADMRKHWRAEGEELVNDGHGKYATTEKDYGDFELLLQYKTVQRADSGIYLRGVPQVQIWDVAEADDGKLGRQLGSGGLWNNTAGNPGKNPAVRADKPLGEWNQFRILMVGSRVSVWLNGKQVVRHALLENYYDRSKPVPRLGPIQLQTHGGEIRWRNVFLREIPTNEANELLAQNDDTPGLTEAFNGHDFTGWAGPVAQYEVKNGALVCKPGQGGTIYYDHPLGDFIATLEFNLPPGGNNGLAIRYPGTGDTAYVGMCELQVLDDAAEKKYGKLDPRQFHGSAYGMAAATRGYLRPSGEWNHQKVTVRGPTIQVELNGTPILNTDLSKVSEFMANNPHPGKDRLAGYFGFAGHNDPVAFRRIRIKPLD
jgi:hypothetical protein